MFGFLNNIGPTEWIVVALLFILFFGSKIVAKLGKTSGETLKEIRNIKKTFTDAIEDDKPVKEREASI